MAIHAGALTRLARIGPLDLAALAQRLAESNVVLEAIGDDAG